MPYNYMVFPGVGTSPLSRHACQGRRSGAARHGMHMQPASMHRSRHHAATLGIRTVHQPAAVSASSSSGGGGGVQELAQQWLRYDTRPASRAAIQSLLDAGRVDELVDILGKRLEFGTAGLRALMGPGFNRMNNVTVQQTSQGLCRYLQQQCPQQLQQAGVAIGFDGRHLSRELAHITAAVFLSQGVRVHLFRDLVPTPFVAAAVAELGAAAGVMVTASHNPKDYNGYKVYWGNGCQIIPPHDHGIAAAIEANLELWALPGADDMAAHPLLSDPMDRVSAAYFARLRAQHFNSDDVNAGLGTVVYTPLHGVGKAPLLRAFQEVRLPAPYVVPEQAEPDPEFPTVLFPNPEEGKGTWNAAFRAGEAQGARLVMANDPDADRLSVAERCSTAPGGWQVFSGNEIGALLAHWIWQQFRARHPEVPPQRCAMLSSTVSSKILGAMAAKEGFLARETLTGFKWLGNEALKLEADGVRVLFAFEEAIGFMIGGMYKDKDGISAAAVFGELAAATYARGSSLGQLLRDIYDKYGYLIYRSGYFIADQPHKSRAVFDELRSGGQYAAQLAGVAVRSVRDLGTGLDTAQPDRRATLPWQAGDMSITYTLEQGATLTLRASGTEPKLKYYLEVAGQDEAAATAVAGRIVAVLPELVGVERHQLKLPPPA